MTSNTLLGHDVAIADFVNAAEGGRMHHAWLLTGEEGIGKSLFAQHAAAFLIETSGQRSGFRDALDSPAARQMLHGSHPDIRHVKPDADKAAGQIGVDQIRSMSPLFQTTAGMGGWRVAILDAADDMNRNAANAILKLLEEPPPRSVFFLISHAPGRLLPTIRSRCRQLRFQPLSQADTLAALSKAVPDLDEPDRNQLMMLAPGSPGRALALHDAHALDYWVAIDKLFEGLPALDRQALLGLADQMTDRAGSDSFRVCWTLLEDKAAQAVKGHISQDAEDWVQAIPLQRWLDFQAALTDRRGQILGLNMSPRQTVLELMAALAG